MIDINVFRNDAKLLRKNMKQRHESDKIVDDVIALDNNWKTVLKNVEQLKAKRNTVTREISQLKKQKKNADSKIKSMRKIGDDIKKLDTEAKHFLKQRVDLQMRTPNLLYASVPFGKDDEDNVELRKIGKVPKFNFTPKGHVDVAPALGFDPERAAKVAGAGFNYLTGDLALLDQAIQKFTIDFLSKKKKYTLVHPPLMMNRKSYSGVTDLGDFETVMYKIEGDDLYLIATSEHPMAAMYADEVLDKKQLPIKFCGFSPCFRREIGSHGKYAKGLYRTHQFYKIEQFIFCEPKDSPKYHEELQKNVEQLYKELEIPIRVVNVCTGDIGTVAAKKYDTEGWYADGKYRELGSNSNCTTYQSVRLNIKYQDGSEKKHVHTLNNTAIATGRTMICLIESHQQKDGSVKIPKALWKYTGFKVIKPKKK
jgi:seryl-tRNA synthetase